MEVQLFNLINKARSDPDSFIELLSNVTFNDNRVLVGLEQWETELTPSDITALKGYLENPVSKLKLAKSLNHDLVIPYPNSYPVILIAIHLCLQFYKTVLDPFLEQISIEYQDNSNNSEVKLGFLYKQNQTTLNKTKINRNYQEKARKIAYEIVENSKKRKKFKKLMLEGNE